MGSLTVLAGLIFMAFIMSVMLADSKKSQDYNAINDAPGIWNSYAHYDEVKPDGEYALYPEGEGCHGSPCSHKLCFPKFVRSFHMRNYPRYLRDLGRHCYVMDPKLCKCLPDEDCVLTDKQNVVEDHVEYEYQCHPKPTQEPPLFNC